MRRFVALGAAVLAFAAMAAPVAALSSTARAVIHEDFGRRAVARPCTPIIPEGVTCAGDGIVPGLGRVTSIADYTPSQIVTRTLTFADGSTIRIEETYALPTFPGNSTDAPGALVSFGNPNMQTFTWVIVGATGNAAGITGSGTGTAVFAGDTLVFRFVGETSLP